MGAIDMEEEKMTPETKNPSSPRFAKSGGRRVTKHEPNWLDKILSNLTKAWKEVVVITCGYIVLNTTVRTIAYVTGVAKGWWA